MPIVQVVYEKNLTNFPGFLGNFVKLIENNEVQYFGFKGSYDRRE